MLLHRALPRFTREAIAGIKAERGVYPPLEASILSQIPLLHVRRIGSYGSFRVTTPERGEPRGCLYSFSFEIPAGLVVADLDLDWHILSFEPISTRALAHLKGQLFACAKWND